ncbi:TPA_asm: RNA-directed RNA polymerase [ssRNA phage Esthiorhiza.3_3]|uniref:RNA-directed RNA polymerase n=2 Tax=Leviviricetes TaxID=2842243 RepID=A0A8S5KXB2_9VIRU|nr:RNA-directed RNA polymerase [ssRNA phage Esthiorhiza.3_3]QDH90174.1 MAG: RNA-dependent RNA polymerase [Leviviridae sp.]DAD50166.1 TPA_asm: RNA-directed RNA polymerase [ssRNA phage Esthiorhiza.3_3]
MKSLMSLWKVMLNDLSIRCCTSTDKDLEVALARFEHEGLSFLTITLPRFGKDLQKGLSQGRVDSSLFVGFHRRGGLPAFLSGFLRRVFDPSGELLPNPDIASIFAVRQLCFVFEKVLLDCSEERFKKAMDGYVQCESDVREADRRVAQSGLLADLRVSFAMLFGDSIDQINRDLRLAVYDRFLPKHGPGATADSLVGNQKFKQSVWTSRLEAVLPVGEFVIPNWRYRTNLRGFDIREPGAEEPVRVISVPKTLKSPRIIAVEPTCMQYAQQAVHRAILDSWKDDYVLSRLINLQDQTPNQRMARKGSLDGSLATIDLSEASDRVSNQLVRSLLSPWPDFQEAVEASRSRKADVPGHGVIRLAKFASMGSALTFPIETMVFLAVVFNRLRASNSHLSLAKVKLLALRETRAYGDDLICPVAIVRDVISDLETFGFKVNADKTFYNGSFRESCGKDYYSGHDVSIVRCRRVFPTSRRDADEVVSMVSFRNQLYFAGLWTTCQWLDARIQKLLGFYPALEPTSPGLGRHSFCKSEYFPTPSRGRYQRPEVKAFVPSSKIPWNSIDDVPALVKCLLQGDNPDSEHLLRSGRPKSLSIKLRWTSIA